MTIAVREQGEEFITEYGDVKLIENPCVLDDLPDFQKAKAWPTKPERWRCITHGFTCWRFGIPTLIAEKGEAPGSEGPEINHEVIYSCPVHGPECREWEGVGGIAGRDRI